MTNHAIDLCEAGVKRIRAHADQHATRTTRMRTTSAQAPKNMRASDAHDPNSFVNQNLSKARKLKNMRAPDAHARMFTRTRSARMRKCRRVRRAWARMAAHGGAKN